MTRALLALLLVACGSRDSPLPAPRPAPARPATDATTAIDAAPDSPPPANDVERILREGVRSDCATDADCTITRRGCCGCGDLPARADAIQALAQAIEHVCNDATCPAVVDERPVCRAKPVCEAGQCTWKPSR